jgi:hypothetical protein
MTRTKHTSGTLYARKLTRHEDIKREPPAPGYIHPVPPCMGTPGGVALFSRADGTGFVAFIPGDYSTCPDRRNKRITINCNQYALAWLPT